MSSVEKSFRQSNLSWDNLVDCVALLCERCKNFEGGKIDWGAGQMRCNGCILGIWMGRNKIIFCWSFCRKGFNFGQQFPQNSEIVYSMLFFMMKCFCGLAHLKFTPFLLDAI